MKALLVILLAAFCQRLFSQEVVATAGSTLSNASGSISYTIGEGVAQTLTKGDKTITQGFQQTNITVSIMKVQLELDYSITVFPNPTDDFLILKLTKEDLSGMQYRLYDINGKLLLEKKLESNETSVPVDKLASGLYIIKVKEGLRELKSFKIIKQ